MRGGLIVFCLLLAPLASAQGPSYIHLGDDATGDAQANGVPMLDTWVDINGLAVETIGEDLVFYLGLEGTTTEAGQYCWMAAFEFGGTEYVGLDCYEGVAYESDNTASTASPPDTSRGENVASSVVFDANGAVITIPIAAIGASIGDEIEDIYGLTYATRGLIVADTVPDAKRTVTAEESLGSYRIGGPVMAVEDPVDDLNVTIEPIMETINGTLHLAFDEPSNATYEISWASDNATNELNFTWVVGAGQFNITITDPMGNATGPESFTQNGTKFIAGVGNWTVTLALSQFAGTMDFTVATMEVPVQTDTNTTEAPKVEDEESPGVGFLAMIGALGGALYARKRRT